MSSQSAPYFYDLAFKYWFHYDRCIARARGQSKERLDAILARANYYRKAAERIQEFIPRVEAANA